MKNINVDELKKAAESGNIDSYINKNLPPDATKKSSRCCPINLQPKNYLTLRKQKHLCKNI